jgi:hypothetical protein
MRVVVHLTLDGAKETTLEGDAGVFDSKPGELVARDLLQIRNIGFWLTKWRYVGHGGPNQKSRVFIPWTSVLFTEDISRSEHRVTKSD